MTDVDALLLTLRLATVTTTVLMIVGTPLAWWLAPTVLGFYLLVGLGPRGPIGRLWSELGGEALVFSFSGLVIGSVVYSLPFVVQPLQTAFEAIGRAPLDGRAPLEVAATLGARPLDRFVTVAVPLARRGFITAATLGFAHTLGEFGVVLMIGGNIPGRTRVASIAIYDHVESLRYGEAHALSLTLLAASFVLLLAVFVVNRRLDRPAVAADGTGNRP
jgi:molybdate transport system permease protein